MASFGWATKPILWLTPAFFIFGMAGGLGDALQRERAAAAGRLFVLNSLVAVVALGIATAVVEADREIVDMVRWKRVLLRGIMLLAVGLNAVSCFNALDSVANIVLRGGGGSDSSAAVSSACAIVAVAAHLRLGWVVVFEV